MSGVDASSACKASTVKCLVGNGIEFVGRYYSRTTQIQGKKITKKEAQTISNGGLQLVALYEDGPTDCEYFSASRGTADAQGALQQAAAIGQPKGSAIYFTVDYDAATDDIEGAIDEYFAAVASAIGSAYVVGVYGSGEVCAAITNAGYAKLAWLAQSAGWSGYSRFTDWAIKQGPEQSVCGLNSDTDIAHGDYGGFTL